MKLHVKRASFSTDNSRTSILSIFYSISNHKNFIPKCLDNVLADFAQTMYSVYSSLRLRAYRRNNSQLCWELLAEKFDRFQTLRKNTQEHQTTCNRVCKRTQHVASNNFGSCWPTMLCPFARGLTHMLTTKLLYVM